MLQWRFIIRTRRFTSGLLLSSSLTESIDGRRGASFAAGKETNNHLSDIPCSIDDILGRLNRA